jgi:hypothetical protein
MGTSSRVLFYRDLAPRGIPWSRQHVGRLERKKAFPPHFHLPGSHLRAWWEIEIDLYVRGQWRPDDETSADLTEPA